MTIINKAKKKEIVEDLRKDIAKQQGIFFVNFKGMKGESSRDLRKKVRDSGGKMTVTRKTLAKIAFEQENIDYDPLLLEGEVGFVFGFEDGINVAKVLGKMDKEGVVSLLGGIHEGITLSAEETKALADLPSREELLAKLLSVMSGPTRSFLHVLEGNTKGLLYVLKQIKA